MSPVPTVGPSFRSLPCWLRRRRLNTSSPAAASGRGCPRPPARAPQTDDDGRGRLATTPSEIPPRGWKDILLRVYSNVSQHRILALAAGMTYYSLLAIFPALAALVAVYGLFADPSAIARHLDQVSGVLARRRHRCRAGAAHARRLEGPADPRAYISGRASGSRSGAPTRR